MNNIFVQDDFVEGFDEFDRFIIPDFDHQYPFSSFLPGIAGLQGIPMWVFYVNRGQGVCSFGVENKDHPILEFQAANKAYQSVSKTGFRTFFNGEREGNKWHREVFMPWDTNEVRRAMFIGMNEVEFQEINTILGYQVNVLYFLLPNLPISALVRKVSIKNLKGSPITLEVLDGLPELIPYGVDNGALKHIGRTIEAWMQVDNLNEKLPFYHLKATPGDTAEVHAIQSGNYALAFSKEGLLPGVADPFVVFGLDTSQSRAHIFHEQGLQGVFNSSQTLEGRSLCSFFGVKHTIEPGQVKSFTSIYGYARSLSTIQSLTDKLRSASFVDQKLEEARNLADDLTRKIFTKSASPYFDGYCRQTFLDNLLRGGYPLALGEHIVHIYSRKHGDLERDYNDFVIPPTYYSQGNGNYRDISQNRRNDVFFIPQAGEFNIRFFMSLIQADGYNPLVINGLTFSIPEEKRAGLLKCVRDQRELQEILNRNFTPGELFDAAMKASPTISGEDFLERAFALAESEIRAQHGEGFWIDHWTYNLDLIDAYLAIFPDRKNLLLFHADPLPFFDNAYVVQPRQVRFVSCQGEPSQLNAVIEDREKKQMIQSRQHDSHWARSNQGQGEIFRLPLFSKLALLALIKFVTRDPSGMGIQMEAGRPGWYDALNGLPGLFGSSMPETCELLRLVNFLINVLEETPQKAVLPIEATVLTDVITKTRALNLDAFAVWERTTDALEVYRDSVKMGFDGKTIAVNLESHLQGMQADLEEGIEKAKSFAGKVPPTYFIHEVTDYDLTGIKDADGNPRIQIKGFKPTPLPEFLEGPVRLMKISTDKDAQKLVQAIKESALFDRKLNMVKLNAPLSGQSHGIGRARAFTPGWLENESIWLHMAFKYLLELLKAGLYDVFFEALSSHLPAFMEPDIYGRSPLENCSFIVSSAHPDSFLHGKGFVARLSGSTAEFLSIWTLMMAGEQPFQLKNGKLVLAFKPVLPGWFFDGDGKLTFCFLGSCDVTVHNPERRNTYFEGFEIQRIELHLPEKTIEINGAEINSPYAQQVRLGDVDSIDLFY